MATGRCSRTLNPTYKKWRRDAVRERSTQPTKNGEGTLFANAQPNLQKMAKVRCSRTLNPTYKKWRRYSVRERSTQPTKNGEGIRFANAQPNLQKMAKVLVCSKDFNRFSETLRGKRIYAQKALQNQGLSPDYKHF